MDKKNFEIEKVNVENLLVFKHGKSNDFPVQRSSDFSSTRKADAFLCFSIHFARRGSQNGL